MMPKKQRRQALFSALSLKFKDGKIIALDSYESPKVKTKGFSEMIKKLPLKKDVLVLIPERNEIIEKSARNIPTVKTMLVNYLNIADLQRYENIIFMEKALGKMEELFLEKEKK